MKKVVPELGQEVKVKVKVDIVTSDDIKICYTGQFRDFTARYIINCINQAQLLMVLRKHFFENTVGKGEHNGN